MADEATPENNVTPGADETPTPGSESAQTPTSGDGGDDTDWKAEARKHEGRSKANKTKAEQAEAKAAAAESRLQAVLKAAGIEDAEVDPDKLAKDLASERSSKTALAVENAVLRLAGRHGANAESLVDSRSFMEQVSKLDPAGDDFSTQLSDAIKAKVEQNPSFRTAAGPTPKSKLPPRSLKSGTTGAALTADPKAAAAEALRLMRRGG
ncbi:MAG: hypothetical protein QM662_02495 [Gordonia sp. (in: high G+C Gram-positive bacteria)]